MRKTRREYWQDIQLKAVGWAMITGIALWAVLVVFGAIKLVEAL